MKHEQPLKDWMARARDDAPPRVDVADAVLRRLHVKGVDAAHEAVPAWPALVAAGAALVSVVIGVGAWNTMTDPLGPWLNELTSWGML